MMEELFDEAVKPALVGDEDPSRAAILLVCRRRFEIRDEVEEDANCPGLGCVEAAVAELRELVTQRVQGTVRNGFP